MQRPLAALAVAAAGALALALTPLHAAAPNRDYAAAAWTILPPGENGSLAFDRNTTDQAKLYDALTPLRGGVTEAHLRRTFKPAPLGLGADRPQKRERPRPGVTIVRDSFGVAHVSGKTEADVAFGAGWVTAADRGLLLQLIRGPARVAALDVPGLDPLALALTGKTFVPSPEAEAFLANQLDALRAQGETGRRLVALVEAYAAGVNAWYRARSIPAAPFTANDVIAAAALIAARFGANGGQEVANAMFLDALEERLGAAEARRVFADVREADDPEAPVTVPGRFPYETPASPTPGSVVVDDGSFTGAPLSPPAFASNALLVGAKRSQTGHPLFVAGPQVGYFFPQFFAELELAGGGFAVRGAVFPGVPFVVIGRGPDFAWSATSSQADNSDLFVETLCGDDRTYLYRGQCQPMRRFFAGTLKAAGAPDQPVVYDETAHGPVVGYATVAGKRVAIALQRSTRGRELLSARAFYALNTGRVTSAASFLRAMSGVEFSFNWFYADDRDIAFFSSGRLPLRAPGTDPALPTLGSGDYDWRGFLPFAGHARGINPPSGVILNWNNRPAAGVGAADSNFSYGSVHRVELLQRPLAARRLHTLASVTAAMNLAATQDLRATDVWPAIRAVLRTGPAPSARAEAAAGLVDAWRAAGSSRLDGDLDGKIDHPGAAVMDAAWPRLADAVLGPVLGPLVDRLAALHPRSDDPGPGGSAFISGWYGYVDKDLRALLGQPVRGPFSRRYCGAGVLATCREALWAAVDAAAAQLEATQGPAPSSWRADATAERIRFTSGVLQETMRWTNRPTFQQLMSFSGHRPR
ncbi:MAG TPA: penicillin acylase family protein [Gaiellaceae bacterium]|nr:penicillin acylase family protein [Gaiellaceae bacterium]